MFNNNIFHDESFPADLQDTALRCIPDFLNSDGQDLFDHAINIIKSFHANSEIVDVLKNEDCCETEKHIIQSFQKNVKLLVQKTWTEKEDEEFKEETIYRINKLCKDLLNEDGCIDYKPIFTECFAILKDVVFLLFGSIVRTDDFLEYACRIDPEFGLFCFYIDAISKIDNCSELKARLSVLIGMHFLANF